MTYLIPLTAAVALLLLWAWRCPPIPEPPSELQQRMALMAKALNDFAAIVGESMTPAIREAIGTAAGLAEALTPPEEP